MESAHVRPAEKSEVSRRRHVWGPHGKRFLKGGRTVATKYHFAFLKEGFFYPPKRAEERGLRGVGGFRPANGGR